MSARSIILLFLAVMVAAGVAYTVRGKLKPEEAVNRLKGVTQVVGAANQILAGTFIRSDKDLTIIEMDTSEVQAEHIALSDPKKLSEFSGAVARRNISRGEALTKRDMVRSNEGGFMSAVLNPGMRAVSIPVNATSGNAGFIFPGDRVDLIVTHELNVVKANGSKEKMLASETFVDDIRVVAIDQMLNNPENKAVLAKTVTLEVTPKQAEMINVAKKLGEI